MLAPVLTADELDDAREDLEQTLAERSRVRSAIRRVQRQGGSESYIEKLQIQLAALDRWADHYRTLIGDANGS